MDNDIALTNGLELINRDLMSAGQKSLVINQETKTLDAHTVVKTIFNLLQQRKRQSEVFYALSSDNKELERELASCENNIVKLKQKEKMFEKGDYNLTKRIESLETIERNLVQKNQNLSDEIKQLKSTHSTEKSKLQIDYRRIERDCNKLKAKIQKTINEKYNAQEITLLNPFPEDQTNLHSKPSSLLHSTKQKSLKLNFKHPQPNNTIGNVIDPYQDKIFNEILLKFEEKEKELLVEIKQLKDSLELIYFGIQERQGIEFEISEAETARFQLQYCQIKDQVEKTIFKSLDSLSSESNKPPTNDSDPETLQRELLKVEESYTALLEENTTLKTELDEHLEITNEQNRLLELALNTDFFIPDSEDANVDENWYEITTLELNKQQQAVKERSEALDWERMRFTEAAIKLGKERCLLQNEREMFLKEVEEYESKKLKLSLASALKSSPNSTWTTTTTTPNRTPKSVSFTPSIDVIFEESFGDGVSLIQNNNPAMIAKDFDHSYSEMETIQTPVSFNSYKAKNHFEEAKENNENLPKQFSIGFHDSENSTPTPKQRVRKVPLNTSTKGFSINSNSNINNDQNFKNANPLASILQNPQPSINQNIPLPNSSSFKVAQNNNTQMIDDKSNSDELMICSPLSIIGTPNSKPSGSSSKSEMRAMFLGKSSSKKLRLIEDKILEMQNSLLNMRRKSVLGRVSQY